ncbi:MAG: flagellar export protein FliJ [Planctomycetaceae bacterium]|jgi:flagellar FliJ protein|nr:flagellar export protein FliJ [Planctomycetaceae bacterium]
MFKFRLEPLITIRDNALKEQQAELAKAYDARRQLEELQDTIKMQLAANAEEGRRLMQPGQAVDVNRLLGLRRQEMFLSNDYQQLTEQIKGVDEVIEMRRNAVMLANRNLKIVEKLKEKRYEKYQDEEQHKEAVLMDEIAGIRR